MKNLKYLLFHGTVVGHKFDHLAINSTTAVAAKVGVNLDVPATAVVEFTAKWFNLYPLTVYRRGCIDRS